MVSARRVAQGLQVSFSRHLLVDGSNVLHAWPELRALLASDRETARAQLAQQLTAIHDVEQVRVTIVFDGRGAELAVERPFGDLTFSVLHTPSSLAADDVIEQLVANSADPSTCLVASDDNAERETVAAAGASVLRAADLQTWARQAAARQTEKVATLRAAAARQWRQPDA